MRKRDITLTQRYCYYHLRALFRRGAKWCDILRLNSCHRFSMQMKHLMLAWKCQLALLIRVPPDSLLAEVYLNPTFLICWWFCCTLIRWIVFNSSTLAWCIFPSLQLASFSSALVFVLSKIVSEPLRSNNCLILFICWLDR